MTVRTIVSGRHPHRDGRRTLCAAEGVLAVLRHCTLDEAFTDIVGMARRHNVAPLRLAAALLARAQCDPGPDVDHEAAGVVDAAWGDLLGGHEGTSDGGPKDLGRAVIRP